MANGRVKGGAAVLDRPMETASSVSQGPSRAELEATIAAIGRSQAVIEFKMDGTVITANDNFLKALGYTLEEIKGQHHSMFVDEAYRQSSEYREFWARLNRGECQAAEYKRIGKGGKEVWIQASCNPILDPTGKPFKVVKFATDVTEQKLALSAMLADAAMLTKAAVEGRLATRADASKHRGDYRKVVEGVNATLDAVIGPLNVSAEYVDRISKGDIPPKITDTYNGDFNEIKNNLNNCIDAMNCLKEADDVLTADGEQRLQQGSGCQGVGSVRGSGGVRKHGPRENYASRKHRRPDFQGRPGRVARLQKDGRRSEHDILVPSLIA